jgi:hypothetical protein
MTLEERVAEMKDQTPPEIRQAGTANFPRREAASFNQPDAVNPAIAALFHAEHHWRGVTDPERWA